MKESHLLVTGVVGILLSMLGDSLRRGNRRLVVPNKKRRKQTFCNQNMLMSCEGFDDDLLMLYGMKFNTILAHPPALHSDSFLKATFQAQDIHKVYVLASSSLVIILQLSQLLHIHTPHHNLDEKRE